ncbi:hypothetical protein [Pseudonocardia sp. ICBG601]|uniref:hypothetical protein n=1 Tax=Pseudonocardia sp. ICBG601 TaxID=2846759 RepID=UPI001CF6C785|nr:hypothetical protein [Pseudonocardia sp. ICBG601]
MGTKRFACASRVIGTVLAVAVAMGSATGIASADSPAVTGSTSASVASDSLRAVAATSKVSAARGVDELAAGLGVIASIPDSALVSDSALQQWFSTAEGVSLKARAAALGQSPQRGVGDIADCASAVGQVVLGIGVPAVRLLKIKKLISEMGGVWESAKLLAGAGTAAEKGDAVMTALGSLIGELSGISGVVKACPKLFK